MSRLRSINEGFRLGARIANGYDLEHDRVAARADLPFRPPHRHREQQHKARRRDYALSRMPFDFHALHRFARKLPEHWTPPAQEDAWAALADTPCGQRRGQISACAALPPVRSG